MPGLLWCQRPHLLPSSLSNTQAETRGLRRKWAGMVTLLEWGSMVPASAPQRGTGVNWDKEGSKNKGKHNRNEKPYKITLPGYSLLNQKEQLESSIGSVMLLMCTPVVALAGRLWEIPCLEFSHKEYK